MATVVEPGQFVQWSFSAPGPRRKPAVRATIVSRVEPEEHPLSLVELETLLPPTEVERLGLLVRRNWMEKMGFPAEEIQALCRPGPEPVHLAAEFENLQAATALEQLNKAGW